ncbi:MAG: hypothetical protein H6Q90_3722 [Deltaproteobacteria bacterium]|nr:hypothetical protein [Deltaproteobacteria bacterium]
MVRIALCIAVATAACTPAQAPRARRIGEALALGGVAGLIVTAAATGLAGGADTKGLLIVFSVSSAIGVGTYAAGDLAEPGGPRPETRTERNHRWAKILTERAAGAAREGRCARVRRLEIRVRTYDPELHDFVFLRDPEIAKCLAGPPPELAPVPSVPLPGSEPAPVDPEPAEGALD